MDGCGSHIQTCYKSAFVWRNFYWCNKALCLLPFDRIKSTVNFGVYLMGTMYDQTTAPELAKVYLCHVMDMTIQSYDSNVIREAIKSIHMELKEKTEMSKLKRNCCS